MICQDEDVLDRVTEFDFDLNDDRFVQYYKDRTGIDLKSATIPWGRMVWLLTSEKAEDWLRNSTDCIYQGSKKTVPFAAREVFVNINRRSRARLQDCWELYRREVLP